jgi:glucokinase
MTDIVVEQVFVGVDIGGSHIGIGLVKKDGCILLSTEVAITSHITPAEVVDIIVSRTKAMIDELYGDNRFYKVTGVGIGCPGQACNGVLVAASNLPNFKNVPLADLVSSSLNALPTTLLNDADAAISAEVWGTEGIYDEFSNLAMITLGTGIGSALILDGQLYQGSHGLIEGGHMIVSTSTGSRMCGCGQAGCVEAYASASSTVQRLEELDAKLGRPAAATPLTGVDVFRRFNEDDPSAISVLEEVRTMLLLSC